MLTVLLLVVALALAGLLYVWTAWFQGYIYESPAEELYWRAPAAAAAVTAFLALWVILDARWPGDFQVFTQFEGSKSSPPVPELEADSGDGELKKYKLVPQGKGRYVYTQSGQDDGKALTRPLKIVLTEGEKKDKKAEFLPEMKDGKLVDKRGDYLAYTEVGGQRRTMSEISLGVVTTSRNFLVNLIVNLLFLGVWFVSVWLLLRFQWPHALIQAAVVWIVLLLFVVAPLLSYAEGLGR
jgi:hypothetical protein